MGASCLFRRISAGGRGFKNIIEFFSVCVCVSDIIICLGRSNGGDRGEMYVYAYICKKNIFMDLYACIYILYRSLSFVRNYLFAFVYPINE